MVSRIWLTMMKKKEILINIYINQQTNQTYD